jgi:hypothetical protein
VPTRAAVLDHDAAPTVDVVRLVAGRMPDRGKRRKDIAISQMGQDAYKNVSEIRNCVTLVTTKLFLHTQVWWWQKPSPPTRHSIRADPDALRRLLALFGPDAFGRQCPLIGEDRK